MLHWCAAWKTWMNQRQLFTEANSHSVMSPCLHPFQDQLRSAALCSVLTCPSAPGHRYLAHPPSFWRLYSLGSVRNSVLQHSVLTQHKLLHSSFLWKLGRLSLPSFPLLLGIAVTRLGFMLTQSDFIGTMLAKRLSKWQHERGECWRTCQPVAVTSPL